MTKLPLSLVAAATLALSASAQQGVPSSWNAQRLSAATYLILDPEIQGNPNLITGEQRAGVLRAMRKDSGDAIKRRYPKATITTDASAPNVIRVSPALVAPSALLPWSKLTARLTFALPEGPKVVMNEQHTLLTVWQHQADAANFVFDRLAQKLP
ncbi:hypothetical protein [Deinococcus hohokamensis]|uniref:Uncharacterized protein n=1 Tax=Deinococcus hohokamensis TaxID=309883 RepID=A0ABV9IDR2_9DEIO